MPVLRRRPVGLVEMHRLWRDTRLDELQCRFQVPTLDACGIDVFLEGEQRRFLADGHHLLSDTGVLFLDFRQVRLLSYE